MEGLRMSQNISITKAEMAVLLGLLNQDSLRNVGRNNELYQVEIHLYSKVRDAYNKEKMNRN